MRERRFDLDLSEMAFAGEPGHDEVVPGLLWLPDPGHGPAPLVLVGHGFGSHKGSAFLRPAAFGLAARHGIAAACLDAPGHGDRQPDGGLDFERVDHDWRAHWRDHGASVIAAEHRTLVDALQALPEVAAGPLGWWGLSLATMYGLGVIAAEPRIAAAVLGLAPLPGPRVEGYARRVHCPVWFVLQEDDEVWPAERCRELFERIASDSKELHASPGGHEDVPDAVIAASLAFLAAHVARA